MQVRARTRKVTSSGEKRVGQREATLMARGHQILVCTEAESMKGRRIERHPDGSTVQANG